jgi:hypothetical protein
MLKIDGVIKIRNKNLVKYNKEGMIINEHFCIR